MWELIDKITWEHLIIGILILGYIGISVHLHKVRHGLVYILRELSAIKNELQKKNETFE